MSIAPGRHSIGRSELEPERLIASWPGSSLNCGRSGGMLQLPRQARSG